MSPRDNQVDSLPVYSLYGLRLATDFPFTSSLQRVEGPPDLSFTRAESEEPVSLRDTTPVFISPYHSTEEQSILYVYRGSGFDLFHFPEVVDIYCRGDTIEYYTLDERYAYLAEIYFLGWIMAYWLERNGVLALHGASVSVDGHALLLLGENHAGKSSLAATLMKKGYDLISDDLLSVERSQGRFRVRPSYPQMRMWDSDARRFRGSVGGLKVVHPALGKWAVPVDRDIGSFATKATPIRRIYLLDRTDSLDSPADISRLSPVEALVAVNQHSFLRDLLAIVGNPQERFHVLTSLIQSVDVRELHIRNGERYLAAVADAIIDDFVGSHLPGKP